MAGLGIGPDDFAIFAIGDPDDRARAIDAVLVPKLGRVAAALADGISRIVAATLQIHAVPPQRRRDLAPGDAVVVFAACSPGSLDRPWTRLPFVAFGASRAHLHARVGARVAADPDGALRRALAREAPNLARKGKPFRKLRPFMSWDGEDLPEVGAAHSAAFWQELAAELAPSGAGVDVGIAWSAEEARSLAVGDVLGAYRDLAPIYKLLATAAAPKTATSRPADAHAR
jgi:hypothetical protein